MEVCGQVLRVGRVSFPNPGTTHLQIHPVSVWPSTVCSNLSSPWLVTYRSLPSLRNILSSYLELAVNLIFSLCRNEYALMEDNLMEFQDLRRVDDGLKSTSVEMAAGVIDSGGGDGQEVKQEEGEGETVATHVCDPISEAITK